LGHGFDVKEFSMRILCGVLIALALAIFVFVIVNRPIHEAAVADEARSTMSTAALLIKQNVAANGTSSIRDGPVYSSLLEPGRFRASQTNVHGEVVDSWKTPLQVEFLDSTNFILISAGPMGKFGDWDDIIFNSISNAFVNP
jgi:hypothetical protein